MEGNLSDELKAAFRVLVLKYGALLVVTSDSANMTLTLEDADKNVHVIDKQCYEPDVFEFNKAYVTLSMGSTEDINKFLVEHVVHWNFDDDHIHHRICVTNSEQMTRFISKDDTFKEMYATHMERLIRVVIGRVFDEAVEDAAEAPDEADAETI